ncbi:MAG: pseudoazurin [Pseudomonadota bacterium]
MFVSRRRHLALWGAAVWASLFPMRASAGTVHEVQMLNHDPDDKKQLMVFHPDIVRAQPGDTIRFLAIDTNHNSESFKKMLPEGVERWKSKIGKEFDLVVETEGAYGYFCTPHKSYGMVGLLLVGDVSSNYEELKTVRQRGKSKKRFKDIFERADALLAAEA